MLDSDVRHPISLCVSKQGDARFMGQLDFLRLIERSLRRSELPVQYTQGFNPRIKLTFSDALPLGVASTGEWIRLILNEDLQPEEIRARLEPALPESVGVVDVRRGSPPEDMPTVRYRMDLVSGERSVADALTALLTRKEFHVKDPRRERTVDVRSFLRGGCLNEEGAGPHLLVDLVAVDGRPPRPGLLAEALVQLTQEMGGEPPGFGVFTKLAAVERRQGAETWPEDAVAVTQEQQVVASCSSTQVSPMKVG
ncbi:MAG: TIGR03936 family radical SAM-associated protein [Planctomycetota bacterium]|nr:TIGR03936 family radical SAM-associated protein [Planctomycetota bacterium]